MLIPINHKIHSFIVVYFEYFNRNSAKSTTPVSNRKLIPTRRNEKSSSTWWGGDNVLRRIDLLIQYGVSRRVDSEFLSEFRRNKAVKFNSGQYINDTLEGGPLGPNFSGRLFHGSGHYQGIYGNCIVSIITLFLLEYSFLLLIMII